MLQLSATAERLSESLVIWSAAGNHPPLTLFEHFWGCFVVFKWVFWHIVVFVPLGFLFLDESFPSAERRSLSTWLLSSAQSSLNNSSVSRDPRSKSQAVLMISLLQESNLGKKQIFIRDVKKLYPLLIFRAPTIQYTGQCRQIS